MDIEIIKDTTNPIVLKRAQLFTPSYATYFDGPFRLAEQVERLILIQDSDMINK